MLTLEPLNAISIGLDDRTPLNLMQLKMWRDYLELIRKS